MGRHYFFPQRFSIHTKTEKLHAQRDKLKSFKPRLTNPTDQGSTGWGNVDGGYQSLPPSTLNTYIIL